MSLYERKVVPFKHDDDSDEDIGATNKRKIDAKVPVRQPTKISKPSKPIVDVSFDAEEDEEEDLAESNNRILKELEAKRKVVAAPVVVAPVVVDVLEDEVVLKAQKLLQKTQSAKQKKVPVVDIIDLDDVVPTPVSGGYVAPKIARANERRAINVEDESTAIDYLRSLTQSSSSNQPSSSSSSSGHGTAAVDDSSKLKLVTRLNGEHEWKWKVPSGDSFSKMKKKFAEIYGVKQDQFKFIFDGSVLGDDETPEDVEMEDSNIIDVKMDKLLFAKAVANATSFAKAGESRPQSGSTAVAAITEKAPVVEDTPKVLLVTRLNGEHEWKWKVSMSDAFAKMKKKFAEIYGVKQDQFKFIFDGSVLGDDETPEDVEMEDSNIIDVKMDKALCTKAVANAKKFKT